MWRVIALTVLLQGCSMMQTLSRDPRDAPWDPKPGTVLFEQIPNTEGEATRVCCGHLPSCQPHQSPRC